VHRALKEWEAAHPDVVGDPAYYAQVIQPRLRELTLSLIERALGVSNASASRIRSGSLTPHVRHWPVLAALGTPGDAPGTTDTVD
jgi:hypothetical protein